MTPSQVTPTTMCASKPTLSCRRGQHKSWEGLAGEEGEGWKWREHFIVVGFFLFFFFLLDITVMEHKTSPSKTSDHEPGAAS